MKLIVAAAVLLCLFAGCVSRTAPPPATNDAPPDTPDQARVVVVNFTGELVATPVQPAKVEHTFDVAASVIEVRAGLNWSLAADDITFTLLDPRGKEQGKGVKEGDTSRSVATVDPPAAGAWKVVITSSRALKDTYRVTVTMSDPIPGVKTLKEALALNSASFAEVNFIMEGNETIRYEWALRDAAGSAVFNIHSHENGETKIHEEHTGASGAGNFTAPHREIYSLLWENKGAAPTAAQFTMIGAFRLHSQTARAS